MLEGLPQTFCTSSMTGPWVSTGVPVPPGRTQTPTPRGIAAAGLAWVILGEGVRLGSGLCRGSWHWLPQGISQRRDDPRAVPAHPMSQQGSAGSILWEQGDTMGLHQGRIWPLETTFRAKPESSGHHPAARRAMCPALILSCTTAAPAPVQRATPQDQVLFQTFKNTEQFVLRLY